MELPWVALDFDFHSRDEPQARSGGARLRTGHPVQRVMVSQRERDELRSQRELDQCLGRTRSVGRRRVGVEIYHLTSL